MNTVLSLFPLLHAEGFTKTSDADDGYNCIAWAAGDTLRWWWPENPLYAYWPPGVTDDTTLAAFVELFESLGYQTCADGTLEAGYLKVVIYTDQAGVPTHAARQLQSGLWTHKMGDLEDLSSTTRGVESPVYGSPAHYMRRPSP